MNRRTRVRTPEQKLYQDQLYGAKVLSPLAVAIIDTPEFQRLAGLKQLGFADLCYRGAHHTRFEHSVGAHFAARTIMRRIVQNHERFSLTHPADLKHPVDSERNAISTKFRLMPKNSGVTPSITTPQSRWRGVTEVVCAAALLHDLGHVPFGHTLEDEFVGLLRRHDRLGGPRLYTMLFDDRSELAMVFSDGYEAWLPEIPNEELGRLVYVILNWKERVEGRPSQFDALLQEEVAESANSRDPADRSRKERLEKLREWHNTFVDENLFHPFMSDVVGNTICADILDYLPRDRMNLGMESRQHTRLQRYFTIRRGTFHGPTEGLRLSIMATRLGHGGQRRDVATAVLEVMRERYEMAERVFYHHKKAAAGAMLAKLLEIVPRAKWPRDDEEIYPAPWQDDEEGSASKDPTTPHLTHLSDARLIDYLGQAQCPREQRTLQRRLLTGLLYRRNGKKSGLYRTLLVVDRDLAGKKFSSSFPIHELRGQEGRRIALENELSAAAHAQPGEIIIYCPDPEMQAKEIDVRLEIEFEIVRPLRELADKKQFTDFQDVEALREHYKQLWRTYVFVSPEVFEDTKKCKAVIDKFSDHYGIPLEEAYAKARTHKFEIGSKQIPTDGSSTTGGSPNGPVIGNGVGGEFESLLVRGATDAVFIQSYANLLEFQKRRSMPDEVRNNLLSEYGVEYWGTAAHESEGVGASIEGTRVTADVRERKADLRRALTAEDWAHRLKDYEERRQRTLLIKE